MVKINLDMPRKTKKQKIKALLNRKLQPAIKENYLGDSISKPKIQKEEVILEEVNKTTDLQTDIKDQKLEQIKKYTIEDIKKSAIIFTLLAISQYAIYYGIVHNIIKI